MPGTRMNALIYTSSSLSHKVVFSLTILMMNKWRQEKTKTFKITVSRGTARFKFLELLKNLFLDLVIYFQVMSENWSEERTQFWFFSPLHLLEYWFWDPVASGAHLAVWTGLSLEKQQILAAVQWHSVQSSRPGHNCWFGHWARASGYFSKRPLASDYRDHYPHWDYSKEARRVGCPADPSCSAFHGTCTSESRVRYYLE